MKTIDLTNEKHTLDELLALAKSEAVLIHATDGNDFLLEEADQFEREVASLGNSDRFISFLEERSKETGDIPMSEIAKKRSNQNC